jgi:hypothetical protein
MSYLPELRASLVKAAHRQRAIADKKEQQHVRSGGRWPRFQVWLRRSIGVVGTLLAMASTVAVVLVALTAAGHRHPTPTAGTGSNSASNETALRTAALRSLSQMMLPPGAVVSGLVPGTPAELWSPADQIALPHRVDVYRVWRLPGAPDSVIRFIEAHRPADSQAGFGSESGSGAKGGRMAIHMATAVLSFPAGPGAIISRQLAVEAVALPGGGTALRADGEAGSVIPRPAAEQIPAGSDSVQTTTIKRTTRHASQQRTQAVSSLARIHALVNVLNALPTARPRIGRCMNASDLLLRFAFYSRSRTMPLAVAVYDVACNRMRLAIGGRAQPDLQIALPGQVSQFTELMSFAVTPP